MAGFKFSFDPFSETGIKVSKANKADALEDVANYVREEMLSYIAEGKSPVKGGKWVKSLTPQYAAKKAEESSVGFANLELSGDLLDELQNSFETRGNRVSFGITSEENLGKAEGHITGAYGTKSRIRPRQFMPLEGEELKSDIMRGIKDILQDYADKED